MFKNILKVAAAIALLLILIIATSVIISNKASAKESEILTKYYTSYTIGYNDTLWDIANEHLLGYESTKAYIKEVKYINNIDDVNDIHSGDTILIPYYN